MYIQEQCANNRHAYGDTSIRCAACARGVYLDIAAEAQASLTTNYQLPIARWCHVLVNLLQSTTEAKLGRHPETCFYNDSVGLSVDVLTSI